MPALTVYVSLGPDPKYGGRITVSLHVTGLLGSPATEIHAAHTSTMATNLLLEGC